MSNAVYIQCLTCYRLLEGDSCPDCGMSASITNGSEYADCGYLRDSKNHDNGKTCDCEPMCEEHAENLDQDDKCQYCEEEKKK